MVLINKLRNAANLERDITVFVDQRSINELRVCRIIRLINEFVRIDTLKKIIIRHTYLENVCCYKNFSDSCM